MADKNEDRPELHTPKAKFTRAAQGAKETTGEFFGNWGKNIGFRHHRSAWAGVSRTNLTMIALASVGGLGYSLLTDIDPAPDTGSAFHNVMQPGHGQGASTVSIVDSDGERFAVVRADGKFEMYNIRNDKDGEVWVWIENPETAARVAQAVSGAIGAQIEQKERSFTYNAFTATYAPNEGVTIPYTVPQSGGANAVQRFGNTHAVNVSFEQAHGYYTRLHALWQDAAAHLDAGNYSALQETAPKLDQSFDAFGRYGTTYSTLLTLGWLGVIGGSGVLAVGQTGVSAFRRRRKNKPS